MKKKSKTFFKQFSKAHLNIIFMRSNGQRLRYYRDIVENYSKVGKSQSKGLNDSILRN